MLPNEVSTKTQITSKISLGIPLISSAMDTVTEYQLAIAMAQSGGLGILHKICPSSFKLKMYLKLKSLKLELLLILRIISPEKNLSDALDLMKQNEISGIPVVDTNNKLLGIFKLTEMLDLQQI